MCHGCGPSPIDMFSKTPYDPDLWLDGALAVDGSETAVVYWKAVDTLNNFNPKTSHLSKKDILKRLIVLHLRVSEAGFKVVELARKLGVY
jgi:hypothetical protein